LTGKPRDATVRAITDVVVLELHASDLEALPTAVVAALSSKVTA
jgi:CRP-like cAMP-binding protein